MGVKRLSLRDLEQIRSDYLSKKDENKTCISICSGTGCHASGCEIVTKAFEMELQKRELEDKIDIRTTGCHGFCEQGPIAVIHPRGIFYHNIEPKDVEIIISETLMNNKIIDHLLYVDPANNNKIIYEKDIPFYKNQSRILFGMNGLIDPRAIEEYIGVGGYTALGKALHRMRPEEIIDVVKKSGLRGRGGAGFPTGIKWEFCRNAKGEEKYVVCNADEGDPGAYMNRSLLEGNPHRVLEGMLIGAYAIGASEGFIYVRHEYPLAVSNVNIAISQMKEYGLIGKGILDSTLDFEVSIVPGAGAFVCGEETALMASIEGKKGEPRQRPPFPAQEGIWKRPTNLNNVETWANIPLIINNGAEWFSKIGTEGSKGTKIFSLVGKINNTGLVEVPMGITLREMVYGIGGGMPNGKDFKAIQTGGPSGGCIPKELLDLPIDFEKLTEAGSIMGSGGLVVMDEDTCMVDVAKYFLGFLLDESCGKCLTCREGIERMLEITSGITEGKGKIEDLLVLTELAEVVKNASMCGLGQTAPNPVISTLRYFEDEYYTHIKDKRCPAGVCRAFILYKIITDVCTGCGACSKVCPEKAISGEKKQAHTIKQSKCVKCGLCYNTCKFDAMIKETGGS